MDVNPSKVDYITTINSGLDKLFNHMSNQYLYFPYTIKGLNEMTFKSHFDVTKDELRQGFLQVPDSTFLVLDERSLGEGKLNENGLSNLQSVVNLVEGQFMHYEYPYNNIEIFQDVKVLIISEGKSLITKNTTNSITDVPLQKTQPLNFSVFDSLNEEDYETFRRYLFLIQHPYLKFTIENEISEKIQKDFLAERSRSLEYLPEFLDRNLNLSKLFAISNGEHKLEYNDYTKVKELELHRLKRVDAGNKK